MFSLAEFIKEGSLQTGNREEFYLLMPVPESHFSDLMTRYFNYNMIQDKSLKKSVNCAYLDGI